MQKLDRDEPLQPQALATIDDAHAALGNALEDAVALSEGGADPGIVRAHAANRTARLEASLAAFPKMAALPVLRRRP